MASGFREGQEVERVQIMTDRETGRSRGFGFVEMPKMTEAHAAIAGLNGPSRVCTQAHGPTRLRRR